MSTNQNTNKNNNNEPSFDEYLAYEELRMIFVIAIETQNFENLEARIAAWEKKYPLAEFQNPEIIRKIKTILNKDFLSRLLGDYMAAKILHEQEKQKKAYNDLKEIIDSAKKSKDYKTAQREVRKWKENLHTNGFSLYSFDRIYRARICTLLLLPSKELKNQEQATDELKKIKESGNSMDSKAYFEAISNWQNTYAIADFPDKLKKELNQITTEIFNSISQKRNSENAIAEIQNVLSSKSKTPPADSIACILSKYDYKRFDQDTITQIETLSMEALSIQKDMLGIPDIDITDLPNISPTETQALVSLTDILNKTPHDTDAILNWIYVNRKINYSEFARNEIISQLTRVGYKIPEQTSYSIPEINPNLDYLDPSKIDDLRKDVILNYLGILYQGKTLTLEGKDNLIDAHIISAEEALAEKNDTTIMFLEAFDTVLEQSEAENEKLYDENGELDANNEEETIYNIFIEDIMDNPLVTYSITTSTGKEISTLETAEEPQKLEQQKGVSSLVQNIETENHLTQEDNENLEQAYQMSTYVLVATPILEQALEENLERKQKKKKSIEKTRDL